MKLNRAVVVAICLVVGIACVWAAQTASTPKPAATATSAPAPTPAPAPASEPNTKIDFKSDQEKLSYAIGCQIGTSLKGRSPVPNMPPLVQGLTQALNGQPTDEEKLSYALGCQVGTSLKSRSPAPNVAALVQGITAVLNGQPTDEEKLSYALGCQVGTSLKGQDTPMDMPMLTQAMTQAVSGQPVAMTTDQIRDTITAWQKDVQAKAEKKRQEQAAEADKKRQEQGQKNLTEGKAFLEANAKKEGVKVLPSGLQYKVIKEGTGNTPTATDRVKVNYKGTFTDGTEFESTYKQNRPAELGVGGVIKGWIEALQLMKEGSKWELYIPADLAYGVEGKGTIPPNTVLIFELELLQVVKGAAPSAAAPAGSAPITIRATPSPGTNP